MRAFLQAAGRLAAAAVVVAAMLPTGAGAAAPRASFTDVEDEVMCIVCGVSLSIADAPQADRERAFIRRLIRQGRTKAQIKQALVQQFGPQVLALPAARGFSLAAYIVPVLAVAFAAAALVAAARRWRRTDAAAHPPPAQLSDEDRLRLDSDLRSFDG